MTARDMLDAAGPPDQAAEHEGRDGHMLSALSNEMVALYKTQLGRGPTKVRSNWAGWRWASTADSVTRARSSSTRRPRTSSRWQNA
jgi:hypothetical protein